jgi:hypothetical protein
VLSTNPDLKKESDTYIKMITEVIQHIFEGEDVSSLINAVKSGDINAAKQEYAKANFNYYMSKKKDEGVLYISLVKDPIMTVFFKDADELAASGLRLHAGTAYITSVKDVRLPYPQIEIIDTSAGGGAASTDSGKNASVAPAADTDKLDAVADKPRLVGPGARTAKLGTGPNFDEKVTGRRKKS